MRAGLAVLAALAPVVGLAGLAWARPVLETGGGAPTPGQPPSEDACRNAWNAGAPAVFRDELRAGGFVDVSVGQFVEAAGGSPSPGRTGCTFSSRRDGRRVSFMAVWEAPNGYTWPLDGRSDGVWGHEQDQRFVRSDAVAADGGLVAVRPAERTAADCIAGWNVGVEPAAWNRLRRAPYALAEVSTRMLPAGDAGCSYRFTGRGLVPLTATGTWSGSGLLWDRTPGPVAAATRNARVLGDASLLPASATPGAEPVPFSARLVLGVRRVILNQPPGCPQRRVPAGVRRGRVDLVYPATRTTVAWRPAGGALRVLATRTGPYDEVAVTVPAGKGVLRVDSHAPGYDLTYRVCLADAQP